MRSLIRNLYLININNLSYPSFSYIFHIISYQDSGKTDGKEEILINRRLNVNMYTFRGSNSAISLLSLYTKEATLKGKNLLP